MTLANYHGTAGGYCNHACRCDACRAAWRTYAPGLAARERYRRRLGQQPRQPARPIDTIHGQRYTYNKRGCRCDECRAAVAAYMRARRAVA